MSEIKKTLTIEQEESFNGLVFIFRMSALIGETPTGVDFSLKKTDTTPDMFVSGTVYQTGRVNVSISGSEVVNMTGVEKAVARAKELVSTALTV